MPSTTSSARIEVVQAAARKARLRWNLWRRRDARALIISIVTAALVTLLTGLSAAGNQPIIKTWKFVAWAAAGLSSVGAIATGLRQAFGTSEKLQKGAECAGRLRALEYALSVGTTSEEQADT